MEKKANLIVFIIIAVIVFKFIVDFSATQPADQRIMKLSLSSDGKYAISTDMSKHAVLWDLENHKTFTVASNVNIYSAYFIKNTDYFMYQNDRTNTVYIKNVDGALVKKLTPGFATYGETMTSDLAHYIASDKLYQLFEIDKGNNKYQWTYAYCDAEDPAPPSNVLKICSGFIAGQKLFNQNISADENFLVTSGFSDVFVFDIKEHGKLMFEKGGDPYDAGLTYATISPDNKSIVSGDVSGRGFVFDARTGKIKQEPDFFGNRKLGEQFCDSAHSMENGYCPFNFLYHVQTIKFVDNTHYIVVYHAGYMGEDSTYHHVALFSLKNNEMIKYISLLPKNTIYRQDHTIAMWQGQELPQSRYPEIYSYVRDDSLDTAPQVHKLVMSQFDDNGILVYQYHPENQTLDLEWVGNIEPSKWNIIRLANQWNQFISKFILWR